jgi:Fe-S-cluster-containing dehydrogenase component
MVKQYGLVIDLERCTGCNTCVVACKLENGLEHGSWVDVRTIGGPDRDTPEGDHPALKMHYLPVLCMHCQQPPCRDACQLDAIVKADDGIVLVDESKCNGCQACLSACPYGVLFYDTEKNIIRKCTLCSHRVRNGLDPFCLVCCEAEAMYFGDIGNRNSSISKLIDRRKAAVLKPESGAKPSVYYCPTRHGRIGYSG